MGCGLISHGVELLGIARPCYPETICVATYSTGHQPSKQASIMLAWASPEHLQIWESLYVRYGWALVNSASTVCTGWVARSNRTVHCFGQAESGDGEPPPCGWWKGPVGGTPRGSHDALELAFTRTNFTDEDQTPL